MNQTGWWDASLETREGWTNAGSPQSKPSVQGGDNNVPTYKTWTTLAMLIGVVVFIPIGCFRTGDWGTLTMWGVLIGIPGILSFVSALRNGARCEKLQAEVKNICGPLDTVVTVERSQPLEQLRGRLLR